MSQEYSPAALLEQAMAGEIALDGADTPEVPPTEKQETTEVKAPEAKAVDTTEKTPAKADEEPAGAPIASKSGTYTIPYEKLEQARERAKTVEAENEALKAQLAELTSKQQANLAQAQEQAQARAQAGTPTQSDQNLQAAQDALSKGVDPAIFGDFDEAGIAKGIQTLLTQAVPVIREQLKAELVKEIEPLKADRAKSQAESHMGAIYAKHADADEVAESAEFKSWIGSLPAFARAGVQDAMSKGTAQQVIEVFDSFKAQTGVKPKSGDPLPKPEVERRVPASLSEVNGAPPVDIVQQTLQVANNPGALLDRMSSMTPEQVKALMDRV